MNINDLSTDQIRRIIAIKKKIEKLQSKIDSIAGDGGMDEGLDASACLERLSGM
jgi:hypothetical protein